MSSWEPEQDEAPRPTTVGGILREAAARTPDTVALVEGCADPGARRRWTYAQLLADAEATARALAARCTPGERLAVWAPGVPESLVCTYAAALAGLVLVPVNPALRPGEVRHVLRQSGAAGVVVAPHWRGHDLVRTLAHLQPELPALRHVVDIERLEQLRSPAGASVAPWELPTVTPGDVAQLVYTSGTTGVPKGALLTHGGMTNAARLAAQRFGMRPGDVYVQTMPLYHVGGQVVSFQLCQCSATEVLLGAFDPGLVLELVETERATLTCGVPTMLLALMGHPDFARRDLSSLRAVSGGGAVVPVELVRRIEDALGVQFAIVFGQTEASGFISQTHLDDDDEDKAATLGRPLPGVAVRVVDPGTGAVVRCGAVGELEVRAPNVMAGYHDLPGETAEALGPGGWLRTGDLVTMDERGFLRMTGRLKDMIVSGGENIFPAEIEAVLGTHPDVAQCAVVGVADEHWGESAVAVVVPAAGRVPVAADLEAFVRRQLAPFKVPRRWVVTEELPLTASGKVQKFAVRRSLEEPTRPGC